MITITDPGRAQAPSGGSRRPRPLALMTVPGDTEGVGAGVEVEVGGEEGVGGGAMTPPPERIKCLKTLK